LEPRGNVPLFPVPDVAAPCGTQHQGVRSAAVEALLRRRAEREVRGPAARADSDVTHRRLVGPARCRAGLTPRHVNAVSPVARPTPMGIRNAGPALNVADGFPLMKAYSHVSQHS